MSVDQSDSVVIRAPQTMGKVFTELCEELEIEKHYPQITVFEGSKENFVTQHCKDASVVIFTGQYKNYLKIRQSCRKDTLILYNGVGQIRL